MFGLRARLLAKVIVCLLMFAVPGYSADKIRPPANTNEAVKWVTGFFSKKLFESKAITVTVAMNQDGIPIMTENLSNGSTATFSFAQVTSVHLSSDKYGNDGDTALTLHFTIAGDRTDWWFRHPSQGRLETQELYQGFLYLARVGEMAADEMLTKDLDKFKPLSANWRALAIKPVMPDEAHKHQVLAEAALRDKNLTKAWMEYEAALAIFPTWPEGQFNAALISAELEHYRLATFRMQEYLLLVPDAPDAQAAKDKIIIWQDKTPKL